MKNSSTKFSVSLDIFKYKDQNLEMFGIICSSTFLFIYFEDSLLFNCMLNVFSQYHNVIEVKIILDLVIIVLLSCASGYFKPTRRS